MDQPTIPLRDLLRRRGSYPLVAAAADAGRLAGFAVRLFAHVGDVYRRVEVAAGDGEADIEGLRLAALVHEEPPRALPGLLRAAGVDELAPTACAVVGAFGRIWQLQSEADVRAFVAEHGSRLRPILLFEVAHEGAPIPEMERAAELGGLGVPFARWRERLAQGRVHG